MPAPGQGFPRWWEPPRKRSEEDDAGPAVRLLLAAPGALGWGVASWVPQGVGVQAGAPQTHFSPVVGAEGKGVLRTHLEPVVNISPGFPSTNSSSGSPLPSPHLSRRRGPAFPQLPLLPPPAGPPARPPATHQRGQAVSGGGAERGGKEEALL